MRRPALAVALSLVMPATLAAAPLRIDRKYLDGHPYTHCPYSSPEGPALLCLDPHTSGWEAVLIDAGARTRRSVRLSRSKLGPEPCTPPTGYTDLPEGFAAVERELAARPYEPAKVLVRSQRPGARDLFGERRLEAGSTLAVRPPAEDDSSTGSVVLRRGARVLEHLRLVGPTEVIELQGLLVVSQHDAIEVWNPRSTGDACPARVKCPPGWEKVRPLLNAICDGTFWDQMKYDYWRNLREEVDGDDALAQWSPDDLVYLFNAYAALTGYRFTKLPYLNDFFYDPDAPTWLPPACFARFPSQTALDSAEEDHQIKLRDKWRVLVDKQKRAASKGRP